MVRRLYTGGRLLKISFRTGKKRWKQTNRQGWTGEKQTGKRENRSYVGRQGEIAACQFLERQGYQILETNYRCKKGEIDLIARDGAYLVFCEVKFRRSKKSGSSLEAVDMRKQKILSECALYYLMEHGLSETACRFDVVGIDAEKQKARTDPGYFKVTVIKNAFDYR